MADGNAALFKFNSDVNVMKSELCRIEACKKTNYAYKVQIDKYVPRVKVWHRDAKVILRTDLTIYP